MAMQCFQNTRTANKKDGVVTSVREPAPVPVPVPQGVLKTQKLQIIQDRYLYLTNTEQF